MIKAFMKNPEETSLWFLNYSLTTMPPLDFIAQRITGLALNYNRLSFSELPKSLEALPRLKKLYLRGNMNDCLPDFFGQFPDLEVFLVSDNPDLKGIPSSA